MFIAATASPGFPEERFVFRDGEEFLEWSKDMTNIRNDGGDRLTATNVQGWLQAIRVAAARWGGRIPLDIKSATEQSENELAAFFPLVPVVPIFRDRIPLLVNAPRECNTTVQATSWAYAIKKKNQEPRLFQGFPQVPAGLNEEDIEYVEITYVLPDGPYTVRASSMKDGLFWKDYICNLWNTLSAVATTRDESVKNEQYRQLLKRLTEHVATYGDGFFPEHPRSHPRTSGPLWQRTHCFSASHRRPSTGPYSHRTFLDRRSTEDTCEVSLQAKSGRQ